MDSNVNRSIENIFLQNLKCRIKSSLGDLITAEVEKMSKLQDLSSDECVDNIAEKISSFDAFSDLRDEFIQDLEDIMGEDDSDFAHLFQDSVNESENSDSISGSLSSLSSSSIDFLSGEQLSDIVCALSSSSVLQKIEALGTICRLSTLEHLTKQTLWVEIEAGLHSLITSDISFLQDGSLTVFIKMLSSSEPQVVQKGFVSLVKIVPFILPTSFNGKFCDLQSKEFKFAVRVLKIINKFQRCIPAHWLRYPHSVMSDIICSSIKMLDIKSEPMWNIVMTFDLSAEWIKNFMYSSIGRSLLLNAFEENLHVLHYIFNKCKSSDIEKQCSSDCCNNIFIRERIYGISFLSYFLQYENGRILLDLLCSEEGGWKSLMNILMKLTWKLCEKICFKCFLPLHETIPQIYAELLKKDDIKTVFQTLTLHSAFSAQVIDIYLFSSCLLADCISKFLQYPERAQVISTVQIRGQSFVILCINHFKTVICSLDFHCFEFLHLFESFFHVLKVLLSVPINFQFAHSLINALTELLQVIVKVKYRIEVVGGPTDNQSKTQECQKLVLETCLEFLKKPFGILISHKTKFFDILLYFLLDKIYKNVYNNKSICSCDSALLMNSLCYDFGFDCKLKSKNFAKLQEITSIIHSSNNSAGDLKHITFLNILAPSIINKLPWPNFQNSNFDVFDKLLEHLLLFRGSINDLLSNEDNTICALIILSVMTYNFHSVCVLQQKLNIQELLIQKLSEFVQDDGSVLISPVSILLNYTIIKLYSVSGPSEMILPLRELLNVHETYSLPFVLTYPPHLVYYGFKDYNTETVVSLDFDNTHTMTLSDIQDTFLDHFKNSKHLTYGTITKLFLKSLDYTVINKFLSRTSHEKENSDFVMRKQIRFGVDIIVRFLAFIGKASESTGVDLIKLLKKCASSPITCSKRDFDVFISTVFLIFECDSSSAWIFLKEFAKCQSSLFVWKQRNIHLSQFNRHFLFNWAVLMECCDAVIMESLPTVFSAFKKCGVLPSLMYDYWVGQCFWNYLDFPEICNFIALTIIFGGDYAIYYFVAILHHLKMAILQHSYTNDIITYLKGNPIIGYNISSYIEFIMNVENKCKSIVKNALEHMIM